MESNRYTNIVLTVIAVSLLWLCYRYSRQPTLSQQEPIRVSIRDIEFEDKAIPVRIMLKEPHAGNLRDELGDDNPLPVATTR
jgi:hypothetical protein